MKAVLIGIAVSLSACAWASAAPPPNVILMMGDDHGWEETGYNGHPYVKTPVLDEIAATGFRFDNFYAAHPSCSPTRGSFLTGRHPNRYGTFTPGCSLRPEEITIAQILGKAGYRCGHFGKWHLGAVKAGSPVNPGAMGFDEWVSHDNFFELNPSLSRNGGPPQVFSGEGSEVVVREAIDFIDRARRDAKPFLTVIWFGSPHEPYSGLPADLALYDDLPAKYDKKVHLTSNSTGGPVTRPQGEVLRERYAEITAMDRAIGILRKHLASQGLRQDTLLFYCGDNGTSADAALGYPHRGVKGQVYEGGILVPGLIEWPARIAQPRATKVRACTSDLLPTLCAIVGQSVPKRPLDGVDLTAVFSGQVTVRPGLLCFWEYNTRQIDPKTAEPWIDPELQKGTTPLVKRTKGKATRDFTNYRHPTITEGDYLGPRAIIDGQFKLVLHDLKGGATRRELFNLETDPAEQHDLLDEPAAAEKDAGKAADKPAEKHAEQPAAKRAEDLQATLTRWQQSVLHSLTGRGLQELTPGRQWQRKRAGRPDTR